MTLFRCQVIYLAGQRPTNWDTISGLYHSKVDEDLSHDRQIHTQTQIKSPRAYGLTSFSKKMRKSNHLQMLEQRQHLLLNYFKALTVCPAGNRTRASRTIDWHLTNWANQAAVNNCIVLYCNQDAT